MYFVLHKFSFSCLSHTFHSLLSFRILDLQLFKILTGKSGGRVAALSTSRKACYARAFPPE